MCGVLMSDGSSLPGREHNCVRGLSTDVLGRAQWCNAWLENAASFPRPYCCVGSQGPRVPGACCSQKDGLSLAHISLGSQSRSSHSAKRPICPVAPITGAQLLQPPTLRTVALGHGALEAMACEMCPVGKEGDLAFVTSFCPAGSGLKGF